MQYGLTTSVKDKLKLSTLPAGTEETPMFCWEVNLKKVYNRNVLMIVHADTRYCLTFARRTANIPYDDQACFCETARKESNQRTFQLAFVKNEAGQRGED